MIFKNRVDLGLQVLHHLKAAAGEGQRMTVAQLAKKTDKSTSFIEQTMMVLKGLWLVESLRGPGGGYVLAPLPLGGYTYQAVSLEGFAGAFYPDDTPEGHLTSDFEMLRLKWVVG